MSSVIVACVCDLVSSVIVVLQLVLSVRLVCIISVKCDSGVYN